MSKVRVLLTVAVVFMLAISNVMVLNELRMLKSSFDNLRNDMMVMNNRVNSITSSVHNAMNQISQKQTLVNDSEYETVNLDDQYEDALVKVDISFNKLPKQAQVYLMYRDYENEDSEWQRAELTPTTDSETSLDYAAELQLTYDGNYQVKAMVEDDTEIVSEDLRTIPLKSKLYDRLDWHVRQRRASSDGSLTYELDVINVYGDNEELKLTSLISRFYYKDEVIKEINLLEEAEDQMHEPHDIENWFHVANLKVKGVKDLDFVEDVYVEVIAKDGIGKEYKIVRGEGAERR